MRVRTLLKGEIEVSDSQIITFVEPMIGFPALRQFILYQTTAGPLSWLQSVEDAQTAFCVLSPFAAGLDPDIQIAPADAEQIRAAGEKDLDVWTVVVLDPDREKVRTNLRAPILVGRTSRLAKQVLLDDPKLPIQFLLHKHLAASAGRAC